MANVTTTTAGRASAPMAIASAIRPGGVEQIVSSTQASPTEVTTLDEHGLTSLDRIFFTNSTTANVALTASPMQVVTVTGLKTFTVPVNCGVAGATAGAYDYSIFSTPITAATADLRPLVNTGPRPHGLRVGDIVTITASGSTPSLDGAQTVVAVDSATAFRVLTTSVPTTVAGSTTAAHYSKTSYTSDTFYRGDAATGGAVVITSTIGTAPCTATVNIQGSADGASWFNVPYALVATPRTFVLTALTITTAVTTTYLLQELVFWRYIRLAISACTNVRLSATVTGAA